MASTGLKCAQCGQQVPDGRQRFCSDNCLETHKREQEPLSYGHRHNYRCIDCGHQLRVGRRRK
jgi:DNA-directed RNA polymerase subunit RPC12/RpoP